MRLLKSKSMLSQPLSAASIVVAACGSSSSELVELQPARPRALPRVRASSAAASAPAPSVSAESFTNDFTRNGRAEVAGGRGQGQDRRDPARHHELDPLRRVRSAGHQEGAAGRGHAGSDIIIQNAQKSDSTFLTDAQSDITNGASIILSDPEDSGTGASVEKYAAAHGAKVIDYDRLTLGGSRPYYVSFNNVTVGKVMGQGLVSCVAAWHVAKPQVIVMRGDPTDNNATLFFTGLPRRPAAAVQRR